MSFKILPDETLEDLQVKGLFILQKKIHSVLAWMQSCCQVCSNGKRQEGS